MRIVKGNIKRGVKGVFDMKKVLLGLIITLVLSGLVLSACSSETTTAPSQTTAALSTTSAVKTTTATQTTAPAKTTTVAPTTVTTPISGGTLKVITNSVTTMGVPAVGPTQNGQMVARVCCENLLQLDNNGNVIPWLATSWQWSSDYKSLTFTLRKGVKFHDGTDFNAAAVKFCLDMVKNSERTELIDVTSIDVIDDYTIKLSLKRYSSTLLKPLAGLGGKIVSPTAFQKMGEAVAAVNPVGTGPFKFDSYQRDVSVKFKKFDGYWQQGKPYLDGLEFVLIKDPVTALIALKSGDAQISFRCSAKDAGDLQASGNYYINKTPAGIKGISSDSKNISSPFSDIKVRQAMAYALDTKAIAKAMGYGTAEAANQLSPASSLNYNPSVVGYPYNTQKAKDLLLQAGFSNLKTKVTFRNDETDLWTMVQGYFKEAGINLELDAADSARMAEVSTKPWNNQLMSFSINDVPSISMGNALMNVMAVNARTGASIYIPDEFQSKLEEAASLLDEKKSQDIYREMQVLAIDKYCMVIPIYASFSTTAVHKSVHDCNIGVIGGHIWDPENIWLSK
jgi:peptide/nickel transport system substrate-binding protein